MSKLLGKRVQVVAYDLDLSSKVKVGMVGTVVKDDASAVYPIRVEFQQGKAKYFEIFKASELRYLNNRPVVLP